MNREYDEWGEVKARLEKWSRHPIGVVRLHMVSADIRAALQRESEQAQALEDTLADYEKAMQEVGALRQRVEELEELVERGEQ